MRRVIIESPYRGDTHTVARNLRYARACMADCLERGESPFASHLLYPQVLDDKIPEERTLGIKAGFAWGEVADAVVVYTDLGVSPGMKKAIKHHKKQGITIGYRKLSFGKWAEFAA